MIHLSFGTTTIMMLLFFGTNAVLFVLFQLMSKYASKEHSDEVVSKDHGKELSKPFTGTVQCFTNITSELFRTGLIMTLTYVCEKHWLFEHSGKAYSRDLFLFVLFIFFSYAFITIKPVHDLTLLSREQTEEWKGWMQFIFLLYHYFHAEEVYNSVRVMITCYVWMTGFGNFQFFYVKRDFGWLRVLQMLWRLNFSVLFLMWTHGNTWILYYICPMHTFYFGLVYVTMYCFSNLNHSKWGIRIKLMIVAIIIFIIWDWNHGIFDIIFSWLGTESVIGATNGSVYEYYFRTSLDHWSSYLGMIFAINFPLSEQYFYKAKGWPLVVCSVIMGIATVWWFVNIYTLEKLQYNLYHAYYAIIPLTSYIFFRNITPTVRSVVSMSLHDLGKTTLETYLLQHHIWLTSNAKTLLTIIPGNPWMNFAVCTVLFFVLSKELYRITMSLRGMIVPDDPVIALKNTVGFFSIFGFLYAIALTLHNLNANLLEMLIVCLGLSIISIFGIFAFAKQTADNILFQHWSRLILIGVSVCIAVGLLINMSSSVFINKHLGMKPDIILSWEDTRYIGNKPDCFSSISKGHWQLKPCDPVPSPQLDRNALCETQQWIWDDYSDTCPVALLSTAKAKTVFKGKNIVFMGDSVIRNSYHQLNKLLNPEYDEFSVSNSTFKHSSLKYETATNIVVSFIWAPLASNLADTLKQVKSNGDIKIDLLVIGAMLWDVLHTQDIDKYTTSVSTILENLPQNSVKVWLQPTSIVDERLTTPDKQRYMTQQRVSLFRRAFSTIPQIQNKFNAIVDPVLVSKGRELTSSDGVHYGPDVYRVIAQMVSNAYALHFPVHYSSKTPLKKGSPKSTGQMSFVFYGLCIVVLSFIMLITFDGFLGFGYISLAIFGRSYDWEAAFDPIHRKLGIKSSTSESLDYSQSPVSPSSSSANSSGNSAGDSLLLSDKEVVTKSED